jgi:uncharacterized membrane protein YhaH (DUF805 family)
LRELYANLPSQKWFGETIQEEAMNYSQLLFSFEGRIPRSTYWLKYMIPLFLILLASWLLDVILGTSFTPGNVGLIYSLVVLVSIYSSLAVNVKRCHDRGRSGWFILLLLVPLLNLWPIIELYFLRGTLGANQYGPDPLAQELPASMAP